jgi:hypothetical protein
MELMLKHSTGTFAETGLEHMLKHSVGTYDETLCWNICYSTGTYAKKVL